MSQIPMTKEYADTVGAWGEKIENRSLLLDKFAVPKNWGDAVREDGASFWSLMRVASNGRALLEQKWRQKSKVRGANAGGMSAAAMVCKALASTRVGSGLEKCRENHSNRFLALLADNYDARRLRIVWAELEGRLAINLADGLIQNAGINLDRLFGLPLIPGSAVKGVARAAAHADLARNRDRLETFVRVFGAAESDWDKGGELGCFARPDEKPRNRKGAVTFIQAMPVEKAEIVVDIVNVHYPNYYGGREEAAKTENPTLVYFPAVERGAVFAFPVLLNGMDGDAKLLDLAEGWLKTALAENGIGAKTAAGYGWFADVTPEYEKLFREGREAAREKEASAREAEAASPDADLVKGFMAMNEQIFAASLNKYKHEEQYWPTTPGQGAVYQRSLLEAAIHRNPSGKDQRKAMKYLAEKFHLELP
ncbi:MAG: type III-B CRISPR module RAMP protein Cmr6 [Planctomycetota bacterium]|jgi:CRISPR type III-B/RAMP module RAMP protein Cmr6|nr:type III-B CRISPR module RAMP protein Cmr6 [Planctomycetota bacterium]